MCLLSYKIIILYIYFPDQLFFAFNQPSPLPHCQNQPQTAAAMGGGPQKLDNVLSSESIQKKGSDHEQETEKLQSGI
jgi:hypothetical protein